MGDRYIYLLININRIFLKRFFFYPQPLCEIEFVPDIAKMAKNLRLDRS